MAIDDNTSYELTGYQVKDLAQKVRAKADSASLASVATSGLYSDLTGAPTIPTVNNGTLTIQQNGTTVGTFTANQSTNATVSLSDTTYSAMTGATSGAAGTSGLVPAPASGDQDKVLKGDGTWGAVTSTNIDWSTINPYNYSSSEQVVGTWIDGRNVYRKVLTGTTSNTANENPYHNISDLYAIIDVSGSILMTNGQIQPIQRVVTDNISGYGIGIGDFNYYGGSGRFLMQHPASGYQGRPYIIIITYIKTS